MRTGNWPFPALAAATAAGLLTFAHPSPAAALARCGRAAGTRPGQAGLTLLATVDRGAGQVPATWHGFPSVLPVIRTRHGWAEVRLAQRPGSLVSWLPDSDVTFGRTAYRIVIDLATTRLTLYRHGREVFSAPAGVGARTDPTPAGHFFLAFREGPPPPDPGYGPFILVTSAHSQTISDWAGSGDAVVAIHGPLGADREIGTTGARISHGCIRLHPADLLKLRDIPPGTPIDIRG